MPFVKGKSGNEKGKPKGVKSGKTLILDTFCQDIIEGGIERFNDSMNKLAEKNPKMYVDAYLSLLEYVKPKLARHDTTVDTKGELTIKWEEVRTYEKEKE